MRQECQIRSFSYTPSGGEVQVFYIMLIFQAKLLKFLGIGLVMPIYVILTLHWGNEWKLHVNLPDWWTRVNKNDVNTVCGSLLEL